MWSADTSFGGKSGYRSRRIALFAAMSAVAGLMGACADGSTGFRPLYASAEMGGSGASERLAAVDVAPIPGRVGQRIRNELIFQTTGGGTPAPPEYRLDIAIRESLSSTRVKLDGNAAGQVYNLDASYKLVRLSDKVVVAEGKSYSRAGFERMTSIFANVRAREDAENRAAKTLGEELRTRLMAHLSQPV
jgi:LPS-assembly lipoprotein